MDEISAASSLSFTNAQFLEHLSDEEFWDYARKLAYETLARQDRFDEYILCNLWHGRCMLSLAALYEVVPLPFQYTLLPTMPLWMLGLIAWRGEVIAVADLEAYLLEHLPTLPPNTRGISSSTGTAGLLLVVYSKHITLGLAVAGVETTLHLLEEHVHPPEPTSPWFSAAQQGIIAGIYRFAIDNEGNKEEAEEEQTGDIAVLDVSAILMEMVRQIGMSNFHE